MSWALLGAGLLLELGLLAVASASAPLSESRGFRDAFGRELPLVAGAFAALRPALVAPNVLLVSGLAVSSVAYVAAIAVVRVSANRWTVLGLSLVYVLTLLLMPGLLSTDLLTYATYGRLAAVHGLNPYLASPSAAPGDPLVQWLDTRPEHASPYGPVWTTLSVGLAWLTLGLDPLVHALGYRVLGALAHLAGTALVWRFAPRDLILFTWNPLLLIEGVGSGHNDGPMMVLALAGVLLLTKQAARPGLFVLTVASLVKYVPALVVLYFLVCQRRWLWTAAGLLALSVVLWLPWFDDREAGALLASLSAGGERYVNALVDLPTAWLATHVVDRAGQNIPAAEAAIRFWPRLILRLLFVLYVALEAVWLYRATQPQPMGRDAPPAALPGSTDGPTAPAVSSAPTWRPALEAGVRSYLVFLLLVSTQVLSWYFVWPVVLAAALGWGSTLARIAVAYSVLYLPVFYAIHEDLVQATAPWLIGYAFLPVIAFRVPRWRGPPTRPTSEATAAPIARGTRNAERGTPSV